MLTIRSLAVGIIDGPGTINAGTTCTVVAELRYDSLCTNFTHDISGQTLSGRMLMQGSLWASTFSGTFTEVNQIPTTTVVAPPLTLTVGTPMVLSNSGSTYSLTCVMTGGFLPPSVIGFLDTVNPITSVSVHATAALRQYSSALTGGMDVDFVGYRVSGSTMLPVASTAILAQRGGSCGV